LTQNILTDIFNKI